jgi:hypothetical protein
MRVTTIANSRTRVSARGLRTCNGGENLDLVSYFGPSGPSCLGGGGVSGPPPVSPVFLNPVRVDFAAIGNRH